MRCNTCGNEFWDPKEKMTDVNIATRMIIDAYDNAYDVAILVSGDSDLVPPLREIRNSFPSKEIIIAFPPNRDSNDLKKSANSCFVLGKQKLRQCQFNPVVYTKFGYELKKPPNWL